jgi:hypothetical protein
MKEDLFFKHVRETTFTKDYTLCGKVVEIRDEWVDSLGITSVGYNYELHIGTYVFPVDEQFEKKVGTANSLKEATEDPLLIIKLTDGHSLHTFLDFAKTLVPRKAVKKKVYMEYTIE